MGKKMKKTLLALAAMAFSGIAMAQEIDTEKLSAHDKNAPIGFAAGVTGGEGGTTVTVETYSALKAQLTTFDQTKKTIYVKGTITFDGQMEVRGVKNKTIIGLEGATLQNLNEDTPTANTDAAKKAAINKTGVLLIRECDNIVIRNLTFKSAGACDFNANDNLYLYGSTNVWVDHCDFQDGVDGNFDIALASDNVSVTWCRFRYLKAPRAHGYGGSSNDHRFTNLIGNDDSQTGDTGKLRTTFYSCWWDEGCKERMPRVRFGKVHTLNCLYSSSNSSYCVGGGYKSNVYIEKCAFISDRAKKNPWKNYATSSGKTDYNVTITGCQGASDNQSKSGDIEYFIPASEYSGYYSYAASEVESTVSNSENGAGATLKFKDASGIQGVAASSQVTAVEYYTLDGRRLQEPQRGINIQVTRRADGTKQTKKIIY